MKNAVIITAKGGNTSIGNKNCLPVMGLPVVMYPIRAAVSSIQTDIVALTTEDEAIKKLAQSERVHVIDRPKALSQPSSEHKDVIQHAVEQLKKEFPEVENICVLLGNTVQITAGIIDSCFQKLQSEDCDSVLTVWKAQDDHPYRALKLDAEGNIRSFLDKAVSSNRQSYPTVYFYDQGVWAFHWKCAIEQKGPVPWVWLGKKCKHIERPWVTGRDIHSWIDLSASAWYLSGVQPIDHIGYDET